MMSAVQNRSMGGQSVGSQPVIRAEEYITKDEVARRLKKTARTIENWQRRGYIPFVKAGKSVIYKWSDVEAHLQQNFRVCRLGAGR